MTSRTSQIAHERNRFVAFAFAAADAFIELERGETMSFVDGAIPWLTGLKPEELTGRRLWDFVVEGDRMLIKAALASPAGQGRFGPINVKFRRHDGRIIRAILSGLRLPDDRDCVFLSVSAPRLAVHDHGADEVERDAETGLLTKDGLSDLAASALVAAKEAGAAYEMTLINLDGLGDIKQRVGDDASAALMRDITAYLRASSLNGEAVSRMADDQFGLIHEAKLDIDQLKRTIIERAREIDTTGDGLNVVAATVVLDTESLSETDNAKALLYSINKFSETHGDITVAELSDGYRQMLDETRVKIASFKRVIADGKFDALYQPIVDLADGSVHHYEALARLHSTGPESSPYHFIAFAEEVGVIADFDIAMCRKVIGVVRDGLANGDRLCVAINLSTRSLETPRFVDELHRLLADGLSIRDQVMFEITESWKIKNFDSINKVIGSLRNLGHAICLDDFGSGAAAFQYLRALAVDIVKIDGTYVQEARKSSNGKAFLKSMASLCSDLGIVTVGEMVETTEMADLLVEVGVDYGQGWLYGKPAAGLKAIQHRPVLRASTG